MGAQQNAQQLRSSELLLRFGHASVSIISLYLTIINHLTTSTYKSPNRISNPQVILVYIDRLKILQPFYNQKMRYLPQVAILTTP
jgi:hypothetical protein